MSNTLILSIETSCDETAIAILRSSKNGLEILTNQVSSQVKLHAKWGGVVPNLAAREHLKNFPKLLKMALEEAQITPSQLDSISVTSGPGLIPALLVGVNYAKTLSYLWEKPLIGIHHIEGHIYANFIETQELGVRNEDLANKKQKPNSYNLIPTTYIEFPILALVVSGGHTQLVLMKDHLQYEIIGQTVDDAVGEAFDKVARILNIGYPGGPAVARCAQNFQFPISNFQTNPNDEISKQNSIANNTEAKKLMPNKLIFPRPMLHKKNFNFSFSGLKTAVLYETKKHPELLKDKNYISEICYEFQQACIDVLVAKTIKAAEQYNPKTILLAGGVSANTELREQLGKAISESLPTTTYHLPPINLTGDNAAMIAAAAAFRWEKMSDSQKKKALDGWKTIQPDANLKMK
ncbi:MAG: tRNA (adenosine(37)-N6)-threonylcarbamoyltransferase complex transferase subunit TsaD [Candidatus Moranbacteria bacterium]|nr:tRNA (adenosine(37)-N6)-threonylcarbamoyltransferase complex transferase subunit TsaD [Candidatus Moranbacteria bacterium]